MRIIILLFLALLSLCETKENSIVYFTREISSSKIVEIFKKLNVKLKGNVGLKVHSGEKNGPYFLRPKFLKEIFDYTKGTFLECNTAYNSLRSNTTTHKELLIENGWFEDGINIDLMDENPDEDVSLPIDNFQQIEQNFVGSHLFNYDSCLVLSHFKGHQMGGYGGALKQLSIGFASQKGKTYIHSGGRETDWRKGIAGKATQHEFTDAMADAASSIVKYFKEKGEIVYINVLVNISQYCDCAGVSAPEPKIRNLGIMASNDPVAIDRACLDLVSQTKDEGTFDLINQIQKLEGENTINAAEKLGIGTSSYSLIELESGELINSNLNDKFYLDS